MNELDPLTIDLSGALIEASAGTGKTYTIGTLYLRLLLGTRPLCDGDSGRHLHQRCHRRAARSHSLVAFGRRSHRVRIMVTSDRRHRDPRFSRSFPSERERTLAKRRLADALRSFDEAAIFTIHGFCQRILSRHAFESGQRFDAELSAGDGELLDEIVHDFWVRDSLRREARTNRPR